jgi:hypothetical protein
MKGPAVLFDFGLDAVTRLWIAIASLFLFAGIWGATSVKQGAFLTPFLLGGFWAYVGWLPATTWITISLLSFLGALVYMRAQENKTVRA